MPHKFSVSSAHDAMNSTPVETTVLMEVSHRPPPPNPARGIFMLDFDDDRLSAGVDDRIGRAAAKFLNRPFIDGLALRPQWKDFGNPYDFHAVAEVCSRLQRLGKKLSLYVDCEEAPPHVLSVAQEKYRATVKGHDGFTYPVTCAPWDRPSLDAFKVFVVALADCPCWGADQEKFVRFADHPVLSALRFNVIGRTHTARDLYKDLIKITGYSRERYLAACVECLTTVQDAFPGIPLHTGFFELNDAVKIPSLSIALVRRLAKTFDGTTRPPIGLFQELLTETKPKNGSDYAKHLLAGRDLGFYTAFQAHNCWDKPFGNNPDFVRKPGFDGINPDEPLAHGYGDFGCKYFEMYPPDLLKPGWDTLIWEPWHETIWG